MRVRQWRHEQIHSNSKIKRLRYLHNTHPARRYIEVLIWGELVRKTFKRQRKDKGRVGEDVMLTAITEVRRPPPL